MRSSYKSQVVLGAESCLEGRATAGREALQLRALGTCPIAGQALQGIYASDYKIEIVQMLDRLARIDQLMDGRKRHRASARNGCRR
jgi:hypothetical protein